MTDYGVTDAGFVIKPYSVIVAELTAAFQASPPAGFGPLVNLQPDSPYGRLLKILADREASWWQLLQSVYDTGDADKAVGQAQDALYGLIGFTRLGQSYSTVTETFYGPDGEVIGIDQIVTSDAGDQFKTTTAGTIAGGQVDLPMQAVNKGPIRCPAGSLTNATGLPAGVTCTNIADAVMGRDYESNPDFKIRRAKELQSIGAGTWGAVAARMLLDVACLTDCVILENDTSETDAYGQESHSIQAVVSGPTGASDYQDVADELFAVKGAGIAATTTVGNVPTQTVIDSEGTAHQIDFTLAVDVDVWMHVVISANNGFNFGQAQKTYVGCSSPEPETEYTLIVAGVEFTYTSSASPTAGEIFDDFKAQILAAVNADYVPVIPTRSGDGLLLTGQYAGNSFSVTVAGGLDSPVTDPTVNSVTQKPAGDQESARTAIIEAAESMQTIGKSVKRMAYSGPVIDAEPNLEDLEIYLSTNGGDPDVHGAGENYTATNATIARTSKAVFDLQRVTVYAELST